MSRHMCFLFFVLVLLAGCSSQYFEPALDFEIPETELPLAEPGPYEVGKIFNIKNYDENRDDRKVTYSIYYPSIDDEPDSRGAPFPLIISDGNMRSTSGEHLASHGFIIIGLSRPGGDTEGDEVIHHPLDLIFVLNQLSEDPPDILDDLIDTDHIGVWGYSGFSRVPLILSGAQINPDYYFEICENPEIFAKRYGEFNSFVCEPYEKPRKTYLL